MRVCLQIIACLLFMAELLNAQKSCIDLTWPPETRRDTITVFKFLDKTIPVKGFGKVKPTSNFSFKTKHYKLMWAPVHTNNIYDFIDRSFGRVKSMDKIPLPADVAVAMDSLNFKVILTKTKLQLVAYTDKKGNQDIFLFTFKQERYLAEAATFLSQYKKHDP